MLMMISLAALATTSVGSDSEEDAEDGDSIVDEEDDDFESELNGRKYYLDGLLDDIAGDDVIAETNSGKLLGKRRNGVPEAG